jgi:hypothetical protein
MRRADEKVLQQTRSAKNERGNRNHGRRENESELNHEEDSVVRVELSIVFTLVFLGLGALLVYESDVSAGDLTQSVRIIGGAALLAVGLTMPMVMKKNRKWKKTSRHSRHV